LVGPIFAESLDRNRNAGKLLPAVRETISPGDGKSITREEASEREPAGRKRPLDKRGVSG
jgi:hypothetical protein